MLMMLQDRHGGWVSIDEIHAHAGTMRLNSRISGLRADGWSIEHRQRGHVHEYRLLGRSPQPPLEEPPVSMAAGGSSSGERPRRFVPVRATAERMVTDGAAFKFVILLAPDAGAAWSGADAGLSRASSAAAPAVLSLLDAPPGEQLSLEAA